MKKSKFLKKSLAMLLALMLVVAMIPLSASAAELGLESIYVNGSLTNLASEFTVDVSSTATSVKVGTNEDLTREYKLYALTSGQVKTEIPQWNAGNGGKELDYATYLQGDSIKFQLVEISQNGTEIEVATYTMKLNPVVPNNLTDLASVTPRTGVYSATFDNVAKEVHVVLARHNGNNGTADQKAMQATISVTTANNATINGTTNTTMEVNANDGDSFEVKAASGRVSKFTVVVDEYRDALDTFTITGLNGEEYTGVFSDANMDDIDDTITVYLPVEAVRELPYGDKTENPELAVSYVSAGNVNADVNVTISGKTTAVASDGSKKVVFTDLGELGNEKIADNSYITVKRLSNEAKKDGATQHYNLKVALELDASTVISSVLVNRTWAEVGEKDIVAELPSKWVDGNDDTHTTTPGAVYVQVTTATVVKDVALNGVPGQSSDKKTWTWGTADLSTKKILTVTAENGDRYQYNLSATVAPYVSSASITGFWLVNGTTRIEAKSIENNTITVEVPYMTINLAEDWKPYITPSSGAKAQAWNGGNYYDWINGQYTTAPVRGVGGASLADELATNGVVLKDAIRAVSKNDEKVKDTYDLKIVLAAPQTGKTLENLYITAQPEALETDSSNQWIKRTDKEIYRAISDSNKFRAYVSEKTDGNHMVGDINMEIAPSLTKKNDNNLTYINVVIDYATNNGGVAFFRKGQSGNYFPLTATTNDDNESSITGKLLEDGDQILVLPEEVARWAMIYQDKTYDADKNTYDEINGGHEYPAGSPSAKDVADYGTVYTVSIKTATAETEAQLNTFKVGEVTLTVDNTTNTITGELPWSYTVASKNDTSKATFAEFTMSDYAKLTDGVVSFFSNGDVDGDGEADNIAAAAGGSWSNRKFLFVQGANNTVTVYRVNESNDAGVIGSSAGANVGLGAGVGEGKIEVRAENRLDDEPDYSKTTYTFKLTYADPSNEAEIKTFSIGNYTGVIDGRNITLNVPYGTDLTNMVATFTTSIGATIKVNDPVGGVGMISGSTSVNYTNPVKLYVTSESTKNTVEYTVTVDEGLSFSDVNSGDWFYDNVMDAANNGYVSGYPDGTFKPNGSTTRAEFASMIAKAMGYESEPSDSDTMFPDVPNDFWAKAAINFCAQNGIIEGYDDGTFKPNQTITRQEAAAILNNAFDLAEKYGISDEQFPDDGKIANWASDHVYAAKASGLMNGDKDTGNFRPTDTIKRCEAASILMNANRAGLIK